MTYHYLLDFDDEYRPIISEHAISVGKQLRILKPADDRSINDGFKAHPDDYLTYKVTSITVTVQESPAGGFSEVTILHLERVYVNVQPQVTHGG